MKLKRKLLAALSGGALAMGAGACGDTATEEPGGEGWDVGENNTSGENNTGENNVNNSANNASNSGNNTTPNNVSPNNTTPNNTTPNNTTPNNTTPNNVSPNNTTPNNQPYCETDGLTELPYPGWTDDAWDFPNGETWVVCGPAKRNNQACMAGEDMTADDAQQFVDGALDGADECVYPRFADGDVCGPLQDRAEGVCCYTMQLDFDVCVVGRPFTVDGEIRTGQRGDGVDWTRHVAGPEDLPAHLREHIAEVWADAGEHEHASIASFSRFLLDLMAMGAPPDLITRTTRAIDDEVRHAEDCFSIASAYAGRSIGPGPVDVSDSAEQLGDEAAILRAAILEGCIGETLAGAIAEWQAPRVASDEMRTALEAIADEEGDHALLAWLFVQWMLETRPHLVDVAQQALSDAWVEVESPWATGADDVDRLLVAHGCVPSGIEDHLRRRAFHDVVVPCANTIFPTPRIVA